MKRLAALLLAAAALTGCSSTSASVAQGDPEVISVLTEAVQASTELFETSGMTETVTSAGDDYILSYAPTDGEFIAGLYNVEVDDVIPMDQKELFTIFAAKAMLESPQTTVTEVSGGYELTNPSFDAIRVFVTDGLVTAGEDVAGNWTGTFVYQPDPYVIELLAKASQEQ